MSDTQHVSEPMSWGQICERFPDQWVALVALDWEDDQAEPFRTALVAGRGSRREALAQARPLHKVFAPLGPFFTGTDRMAATVPKLPIVYLA